MIAVLLALSFSLTTDGLSPKELQGDAPRVELYTMDIGPYVWEKYGHSAICVRYHRDPRRDRCYNYGTIDVSKPVALFWALVRNDPVFWVSEVRPRNLIYSYIKQDRNVWLQVLPTEPQAALELAASLREQARPENAYYSYHHYHDNCATRVRDMVDMAVGGRLSQGENVPLDLTYRDYTRMGVAEYASLQMLSDIVIGRAIDRPPNTYESGFLPIGVRELARTRLGIEPVLIYKRKAPPYSTEQGNGRVVGWWLVALLCAVPIVLAWWFERFQRLLTGIAMAPLLFLAFLAWFVFVASPLPELIYNEMLLVYLPTDLALSVLRGRRRMLYARARLGMLALVLLLALTGLFIQPVFMPMLPFFIPLAAAALPKGELSALMRKRAESSRSSEGSGDTSADDSGDADVLGKNAE